MNKTMQQLTEIKLVSITAHTSNTREMNPDTGKIGATTMINLPVTLFLSSSNVRLCRD
ncbi:MAG: hypothetical protein AB2989_02915 [Candidatus Symbiodolus clandestinus]